MSRQAPLISSYSALQFHQGKLARRASLKNRDTLDDKLVCCAHRPSEAEVQAVLRFFRFYARCKGLLNLWRRRPGRNGCDGWCEASTALARARPLSGAVVRAPIPF